MNQANDLFEGMAICPGCRLEHRIADRIEWNFPWGLKLSKCPRCMEPDIDLPEINITGVNCQTTGVKHRSIYAGSFHHD